jgi:hypothetical protein
MTFYASDISWRLSGGASNLSVDASLGGAMSLAEVVSSKLHNIFDRVLAAEATAGDVEYRCLYVTNENAASTLTGCVVWIDSQTSSSSTDLAIGLDPAGVNGVATIIANEGVAPSGVTFGAPATFGAGLSIGDLGPGDRQAIWLRRTVSALATTAGLDECRLRLRGTA